LDFEVVWQAGGKSWSFEELCCLSVVKLHFYYTASNREKNPQPQTPAYPNDTDMKLTGEPLLAGEPCQGRARKAMGSSFPGRWRTLGALHPFQSAFPEQGSRRESAGPPSLLKQKMEARGAPTLGEATAPGSNRGRVAERRLRSL